MTRSTGTSTATTPKAFIAYERGASLWGSRYGHATSVRLVTGTQSLGDLAGTVSTALSAQLPPQATGVMMTPVRASALGAARGATDFGEYFTYFSFFLVVSALVLAVLFFKLGVEQRLRQVGILRASGYPMATIRRMLTAEALVLAVAGGAIGAAGAVAYGRFIMYGLRTWWVGAVGTTSLTLHVEPRSLVIGVIGGVLAAVVCVYVSLRSVGRLTPRALLSAQSLDVPAAADARRARRRPVRRHRRIHPRRGAARRRDRQAFDSGRRVLRRRRGPARRGRCRGCPDGCERATHG